MPNLTTSTDVDTFMESADQAAMRTNMGLGTAATEDATAFATAAQGGLADSAVQPGDLGSAAYEDTTAFATAAQGGLADSAVQPGDLGSAAYEDTTAFATAAQGGLADSAVQPGDLGSAAYEDTTAFATAAQGGLADSALQPAEVKSSSFTAANNGSYVTTATCTVTDPSPAEGQGFSVVVRNGTTTIGGTAYSMAGLQIIRLYHSGAWASYVSVIQGDITGSGLTMSTARILGRTTASTGAVEELTAASATAFLDAMVGDSGSGGTKGLVPAPAAGDAAAGKFLKADGTFAVPSSSSSGGTSKTNVNSVTSSSTSLADITGLTAAVDSGKTYVFTCIGMVQCSTTTEGLGLAINGPTASAIYLNAALPTNASGGYTNNVATAYDTAIQASSGTANTTYAMFYATGYITTTASGTFAMRFKAETGGGNSVTIQPGAALHIQEV